MLLVLLFIFGLWPESAYSLDGAIGFAADPRSFVAVFVLALLAMIVSGLIPETPRRTHTA